MCVCCVRLAGWFSLNVPSGLTLYWFVNNLLSTGQQLYLKATVKVGEERRRRAGSRGTGVGRVWGRCLGGV